jgi:ABC-type oligopeptide transport system substrate-binding subunit
MNNLLVAALAAAVLAAPSRAADTNKALHVAFRVAENGFDPQVVYDAYSFDVCHSIFDALYTYDYSRGRCASAEHRRGPAADHRRRADVHHKGQAGIYFADDPVQGKKRELTAADYVYSIKRIFDPKVHSYWLYVFDHRLIGLDEVLEHARKTDRFDYDEKIEGLQALDRYTLRVRFNDPFYAFQHWLTYDALVAVAREVVDAYKDESNRVMEHPVGTGPYRLKEWTRGQKLVLEANPGYRDETYPVPGAGSAPATRRSRKPNAGEAAAHRSRQSPSSETAAAAELNSGALIT